MRIIDCFPPVDQVFARLQDRSASVGRGDKQLRKLGSTHPKLGQQSARLDYPATLNSVRRCLKVIDTSRQPTMGREVSRLRCCRLIQRHPASPASPSIRLTAVAPANTRLPDPPTNIFPKSTAAGSRSCRPQSQPRGRHSARLERAAATQGSQSECDAKCDSAGVRIRQHGTAQNDRTRCHHSGCSGFFGFCASYRN
jgi:hypothetical protein